MDISISPYSNAVTNSFAGSIYLRADDDFSSEDSFKDISRKCKAHASPLSTYVSFLTGGGECNLGDLVSIEAL